MTSYELQKIIGVLSLVVAIVSWNAYFWIFEHYFIIVSVRTYAFVSLFCAFMAYVTVMVMLVGIVLTAKFLL